nr:hypothetical protein [Tanacetum cinerariifolium]
DMSAEFEDFSNNNINEDNAAGTLVPVVRQLSPNSTNTFSAAGPSNAHVEPSIPAVTPRQASPKPTSNGKRKNRKACFVCKSLDHLIKDCDYHAKKMAQPTARNHAHRGNHKHYALMTNQDPQRLMVPAAVLTQSKPVPITAVRPVSNAVLKTSVARPKQVKPIVTKPKSPIRRHINRSPSLKASNSPPRVTAVRALVVNAAQAMQGKWEWNMSYLSDFEELNGGYVAFGGNPKGSKISGKGKIRTGKLDFDDVYFVNELKFNLFSVSQMCDKKNIVLFTNTECLVLSPDFKLPDKSQVLLIIPRKNNTYNVNLKNIVPSRDLTCLFEKATIDESNLWYRRLGHINFKTMNKLVKVNLVGGLPTKVFENDNTCVAYKKGKQHRAFCKTKTVNSVDQPLYRLRMDLFRPTIVKSLNKKSYCLVVTDDYNRFTWVFFLATKDETSPILKTFLTGLENQLSLKGIKREFNVPRTPQQNGIDERKNKTLIEATRTMLADSLLPIPLWVEAVNTAYYNTDRDAAFDKKEPEFNEKKPKSKVIISPSNSAQPKKQDDKTKREAKGKKLEDITYSNDEDDAGAKADFNNLETSIIVSPIPTTRVHKDHPVTQIIGDLSLATQIRSMTRVAKDQGGLSNINNEDFHTCMFACFLSQEKTKRNKKDERGIVVRNKARLVTQGHTQEEGINFEEVFALVARIEAIGLFLAYASFMGFMVYQMDVKSAFLYGTIEEKVYVCQPLGFEDPNHLDKVYNAVKALYGLHQAPRACQDKYVAEILRKFRFSNGKSASTPIDTEKPLLKDLDGVNTPRCDEDRLELMELMVFLLPKVKKLELKNHSLIMTLTFAETHNMVVYLTKSDASEGFNQILDLLNGSTIKLQALFDKKKVVVIEALIRDALRLDDLEGVECLRNEEIFVELARMGYEKPSTKLTFYKAFFSSQWKFLIHTILQCMSAKRTSWNEFSSSMASAIICLSSGKGFFGVETPLFEGMLVAQEVGEGVIDEEHDEGVSTAGDVTEGDVSADHAEVPTVKPPSPQPQPQPQPTQDAGIPMNLLQERVETSDETMMDDVSNQGRMIADMDQDNDVFLEEAKEEDETEPAEVQKVIKIVTTAKLITKVVTASSETITAASITITATKVPVPAATTAVASKLAAAPRRRTKRVVIRDPEESTTTTSTIIHNESKSKDKGKRILVEELKPLKKQAQVKQDEQYARELEAELNRNINWDEAIDHVNKKAKEDPAVKRYQALKRKPQAQARKNTMVYLIRAKRF